jgi:hypothetical protein
MQKMLVAQTFRAKLNRLKMLKMQLREQFFNFYGFWAKKEVTYK